MNREAIERVLAHADRMPFFMLVSLIERFAGAPVPIGGRGPFDQEAVRFSHDPSLIFHSRDVRAAVLVEGQRPHVHVETTFLGLTGAASPLPLFMTEELAAGDEDDALERKFLDLFHHRLLGLLYRGLLKYDHARAFSPQGRDPVSTWITLLAGFAPQHATRTTGLDAGWLLRFAPLLVTYPPNAQRLEAAVRELLVSVAPSASARVISCVGKPVRLDDTERARLGAGMRLGIDSVLGSRVLSPASRVRVVVAGVSAQDCMRLAPGGDLFDALARVTTLFVPEHVDAEFELRADVGIGARLGVSARLGQTSWLGSCREPAPLRFRISSGRTDNAC